MENIVLTVGGLIKSFDFSDAILFLVGLAVIILLIYVVYLVGKKDNTKNNIVVVKNDSDDIKEIIDTLKKNQKIMPVELSEYDQEMEKTAIISYDELLERTNTNIPYDQLLDSSNKDKIINKVDSTSISTPKEPSPTQINYESEEAFLKDLKKLQNNLVR